VIVFQVHVAFTASEPLSNCVVEPHVGTRWAFGRSDSVSLAHRIRLGERAGQSDHDVGIQLLRNATALGRQPLAVLEKNSLAMKHDRDRLNRPAQHKRHAGVARFVERGG